MATMLLGIDIGTSACKAALFYPDGRVVAQAASGYAVQYPRPGWAEQDAQDWWRGVCSAVRALLAEGKAEPGDIAGIGVDGQSWSAVAVDARGTALAPTPIWTDTRALSVIGDMRAALGGQDPEAALFEISGNPLKPSYTLPKILWYKQNAPDVYARADKILQSNSFIVHRLTGEMTQDLSQGYGLCCFDMRRGMWDYGLCRRLGIRESLLPPLFDSHQVVGRVTEAAARETGLIPGIPVVAGGLDAACATLGAGVVSPGQTQEQGGQAGGMSICIDRYAADPRLILSRHVVPGRWLLQGGTTGGGGALKWLRETCCQGRSFEEMSALAEGVAPGCEGLVFLPYMAGERSPLWNPHACGVFFGLDYRKTQAHLIRAVMEGVAYGLKHNLDTAAEAGARPEVLHSVGGSANSAVWTQIKADVTGCGIHVPGSDTATTLGAALLAGVGIGVYPGFEAAVKETVTVHKRTAPNPATRAVYAEGYGRYRELYMRLEGMMAEA